MGEFEHIGRHLKARSWQEIVREENEIVSRACSRGNQDCFRAMSHGGETKRVSYVVHKVIEQHIYCQTERGDIAAIQHRCEADGQPRPTVQSEFGKGPVAEMTQHFADGRVRAKRKIKHTPVIGVRILTLCSVEATRCDSGTGCVSGLIARKVDPPDIAAPGYKRGRRQYSGSVPAWWNHKAPAR